MVVQSLRTISLTFARLALGRKRKKMLTFIRRLTFPYIYGLATRTDLFFLVEFSVLLFFLPFHLIFFFTCLLLRLFIYASHLSPPLPDMVLHLARFSALLHYSLCDLFSTRGFCYDNRWAWRWSPGSKVRHHEFVHTSQSSHKGYPNFQFFLISPRLKPCMPLLCHRPLCVPLAL
jgi:hypothetical protein